MKTAINIEKWNRKDHFRFFSQFEEPFFGATVRVDCTEAYNCSKEKEQSFFLYYLYQALRAANEIEAFRYRILEEDVYVFDKVNASPTINRPDGTFGFAYIDYEEEETLFFSNAKKIIREVQESKELFPGVSGENVIHFSAIPWLNFSSLSHARHFNFRDSCPKVSFGKVTASRNRKTMPVSIHVHHGLMDGYHVGLFADRFQELMNSRQV